MMSKYKQTMIVDDSGVIFVANEHDYIHCYHPQTNKDGSAAPWIEVIYKWGSRSYICQFCGEVAKKDPAPTS